MSRPKTRLKTQEECLSDFKEKHGDRYDYSLVEYKNSMTKVAIICPKHGVFYQIPVSHGFLGKGCNSCGLEAGHKKASKSLPDFLAEAREKHGDKYDYSLVSFERYHAKVKIICPNHGIFEQKAISHSRGRGCRKCSFEANRGSTSFSYNPEKTDEERLNGRITHEPELKIWRKAILDRDLYACVRCHDSKGGNLNAHHVLPWNSHPDDRLSVDNGITLCALCHRSYHSRYGHSDKCNRKTLEEFTDFRGQQL